MNLLTVLLSVGLGSVAHYAPRSQTNTTEPLADST